jgi:hypothetical protein
MVKKEYRCIVNPSTPKKYTDILKLHGYIVVLDENEPPYNVAQGFRVEPTKYVVFLGEEHDDVS